MQGPIKRDTLTKTQQQSLFDAATMQQQFGMFLQFIKDHSTQEELAGAGFLNRISSMVT